MTGIKDKRLLSYVVFCRNSVINAQLFLVESELLVIFGQFWTMLEPLLGNIFKEFFSKF